LGLGISSSLGNSLLVSNILHFLSYGSSFSLCSISSSSFSSSRSLSLGGIYSTDVFSLVNVAFACACNATYTRTPTATAAYTSTDTYTRVVATTIAIAVTITATAATGPIEIRNSGRARMRRITIVHIYLSKQGLLSRGQISQFNIMLSLAE
jgi:hypothetical protein